MDHAIVAPVVLPAIAGAALVLLRLPLAAQRAIGVAATLGLAVIAIMLVADASGGAHASYSLGDWPSPFGIVLVLDRMSALMVLLTALIACGSLLYAVQGGDTTGTHFHALFQFQLMGLNGAFLTGDLFNLFVFFEVLLIASYCLLLHGGKTQQLIPGLHYVAINFAGSFLFLIAVSLLYGMTGTLNMADMAVRVAAAAPADAALIRSGALLMLVVFAVKAALLPLYFWLPKAYSVAEAPVAALFAIMTKVGAYVILRVYSLIFGPDAGVAADVAIPWLLPAALLTLVVATFGVLASTTVRSMAAYLTIASVGTICAGIGLATEQAVGAAIYYLLHSTLTIALLFLVADLIRRGRGPLEDRLERGDALPREGLLGWLFFAAAIAAVGVPPLSGFHGKVLLLQASADHAAAVWVWAAVLLNAFLALVALARAGSKVFWHTSDAEPVAAPYRTAAFLPPLGLLACIVALTVWAAPAATYASAASSQLMRPAGYIRSVLGASAPNGPSKTGPTGAPASTGAR
ncbi:monovalent cation/H+ antiporter subunit D [Noviherbaspirillum aerium]|uniref:monovalent cation/H+ antiporter subunit D n=1 Tax=Noviherbaspirillum aerium TaxID=2588497 RepID=UPI00124CEDE3|nr:monovalent cation/H+ antiporter subunit D [Noviherbaspirillum aerium]